MLPLFFFPTKVLIVDDDPVSLQTMSGLLEDSDFIVENAESAAGIPKIDRKLYSDLREVFMKVSPDYYRQGTNLIRISNNEIHKLIYSSKRFDLFSVLIVDYHLPIMNGLELIELLNTDLPIKKVLITGDIQSQILAIEAFNRGVIDGFLNKKDMEKLPGLVRSMSERFFEGFGSNFSEVAAYRLDPVLSDFIQDYVTKKQPQEYYLLNERGSYLFLNKDELSSLFIEKESNVAKFLDFMKAENLDPEIYEKIHSRFYMPIMHNHVRLDDSIPIQECSKLEGANNIYYYSYLDGAEMLDINTKKIATFSNFKKRSIRRRP